MFKKFFDKIMTKKKKKIVKSTGEVRDEFSVRLATFVNGWKFETEPESLVKLGFCCGNKEKLVFCCRCRLGIENWRDLKDLVEIHKDLSGSCCCEEEFSEY